MTGLTERLEHIRQHLHSTRQRLDEVLDQVDGRWDTQVYSEGAAWNTGQLLVHLSLAEKGLIGQAQRIAAGSDGVPEDFDIERYNRRSVEKNANMSPEECRKQLAESRSALLAWLNEIDDVSILDAEGRHASLQVLSVETILLSIGDHERGHADDIAAALI